jgi:hypothetical protein
MLTVRVAIMGKLQACNSLQPISSTSRLEFQEQRFSGQGMSGLRNLHWLKQKRNTLCVAMGMYVGKRYSGEMRIYEMFGVQIDSRKSDTLLVNGLYVLHYGSVILDGRKDDAISSLGCCN